MNKIVLATLGSALALSLTLGAFAAPSKVLQPVSLNGNAAGTPYTSFFSSGWRSLPKLATNQVDVNIPQWSLGVIGNDLPAGYLKIANVKGPSNIHVAFKSASGGGASDRLSFWVTVDQFTRLGTYPLEITLENTKFGKTGTLNIVVAVN